MNEFIKKMLELGAEDELACSDTARQVVREAAEAIYNEHIKAVLKLKDGVGRYNVIDLQTIKFYLPSDSVFIKKYNYLGNMRIDIGITDFSKAGSPVRMSLQFGDMVFNRISTSAIPEEYAGEVCTCQTYELEC